MSGARNKSSMAKLRRHYLLAAAAVGCALGSIPAAAQTSFASGTEVVIPTVANISVYHTQVFVRNPNPAPITLNVRYYQSIDATAPAGLRACTQVALLADQSSSFDLGAQCGLNGTDDDFGMLVLEDAAQTNEFFAYARTQTPDGIGFSVEGFPSGNFSGAPADVLGLRALAAAPNYRSNCFVSTLADAVTDWHLDLIQSGTETVLGSTSGSLGPFQTTRILDVFASLGLSGDFTNVRATFSTTDVSQPSFIGFCTLETSSNGSADFRVAKSMTPPPPPPSGLALAGNWNSTIQSLLAGTPGPEFVGSTSVTLAATSNVSVYGGGWFAKQSSGLGSIDLGICYQDQSGPGPITVLGSLTTGIVINGADTFHFATASGILAAGTYTVGLCAQNTGVNSVNKNDHSSGYIFTTP